MPFSFKVGLAFTLQSLQQSLCYALLVPRHIILQLLQLLQNFPLAVVLHLLQCFTEVSRPSSLSSKITISGSIAVDIGAQMK